MKIFNNLVENILPGNYAITKSMEISKVETSGTLWYTKKFLVWYYFIFLSNKIMTLEYINEVKNIFDNYISDMDESIKEEAKKFFFPECELINCKSKKFRSFENFLGRKECATQKEKDEYILLNKKYYFSFIMESGGQSGVKKEIKNKLYMDNFNIDQLEKIISDFEPHKTKNITQIINDYHAFLRNERQILYYYGFFHSKSTGANDLEFSSLTPIGELAIKANSYELLCIWEHQKIKMISQSINTNIDKIEGLNVNVDSFDISYSPYINILKVLKRGSFSTREYKYIISRHKEMLGDIEKIKIDDNILNELEKKVKSFNRTGDNSNEDFEKELKKYLLGIRNDLKNDNNTNPLSICDWKRSRPITIINFQKFNSLYEMYLFLNEYKIKKYRSIFEMSTKELKNKYIANNKNIKFKVNPKIKIEWDLYNIRPDKYIFMGIICVILNEIFLTANFNDFLEISFKRFKTLMIYLGIKNNKHWIKEFEIFFDAYKNKNIEKLIENDFLEYNSKKNILAYREKSSSDLYKKLEKFNLYEIPGKKRNFYLIALLKTYYMNTYISKQLTLKCECCNSESFITASGDPYIEFHHLIPFSKLGPDYYLNLIALCPNCHRKIHYMPIENKNELYAGIDQFNYMKRTIVERLQKLKKLNLLKSYHLEYLVSDNAITNEDII